MSEYWSEGDLGDNCDGDLDGYDGGYDLSPPPPLEEDRVAMMLGLVPDKRTPGERLWDAIRTNGESAKYHYPEGKEL